MLQDHFWNHTFLTHFDVFSGTKCPIFKAFWDLKGAIKGSNRAQNGLISLVYTPQMVHDRFWKNAGFTHF